MAYNPMQGQGMVQITKRPITDEEQSMALTYYGSLRNGSRGMATASMFMAVLNVAIISGTLPLEDLAILFTVLALVVGFAAMALGAMTLKTRKQIDAAFKEGFVIEVRAPAYLNRTAGNKGPMWNIGPISVLQTPEIQTLLAEGAPAMVVCVPGVKAALSVNGTVLKRGATITMPPNLAQMAQPPSTAPIYQPMPAPYPQQQQPQPFPPQLETYQPPQQPMPQPQQPYPQQTQPYAQPQQQPYPQQPQPYAQPQPQPYPQQPQPYAQPQPQPYPQQPQPYAQPQPQPYPQQPQPYAQPQPQPYPLQPQPYPQQPQSYPQPQQPYQQQPQQPSYAPQNQPWQQPPSTK